MLASLTCMRVPCCWFVVQKYAFPADELMPLSCQGRVRGVTKSRGDIDDALGRFVSTTMGLTNFVSVLIALVFTRVSWCCCHSRFSLTLVDSLDTLAVRSMQIALPLSVCGVCVCVCVFRVSCVSVCLCESVFSRASCEFQLQVLGNVSEFKRAVDLTLKHVSFDRDIVVSTFETNIRVGCLYSCIVVTVLCSIGVVCF